MQAKRRQFFDSLAFKFGVIIVLTEMVVLSITGSLYIHNFNTEIDQRIEENLLLPAALLNKGILQLDVVTDEKQMRQLVAENLTNAFVIGINNNIFFSLNSDYTGRLVKEVPAIDPRLLAQGAAAATVTRAQSGLYVSVSPLFGPDEQSARFYLYITADGGAAQARKANNVQLFIIGSLATILATCVIILIAFNVTIFRPLGRVLDVFRRVEAGDLTTQIQQANSRDELGDLARAFNRMATQLWQTLDTLRRERDLIERIMETSPVSITVVNREGQVTFANRQAEQVLGLTKDEITQRAYNAPEWRITDFAGDPFPDEKLPFRQVMTTRQPVYDVQHAIEWPDGRRVFLSINGAPLLNQSSEIESVVFALEDITEREHAEESLRASKERYRVVADNTYDWEFWMSLDGQFLYNSPSCQRITGHTAEEFARDPSLLNRIIHPQDRERFMLHHQQAMETKVPGEIEFRILLEDGRVHYVGHVCQSVFDEQGVHLGKRGSNRDITVRKRAEESLKEQYSTLRSIIDSADALIFSVDRQYRYTSFNQGHAAVMKAIYGAEIHLGCSILEYMTVIEDRETAKRNLDRALAGEHLVEEAYSGEELLSRQYFRVSHSPIRTETGEVVGVAVLAQDIAERKRAEEALRESEARYKSLFENSPISLWEEDFSQVKAYFDKLRASDITNFRTYFESHPEAVAHCAELIKVLDVNQATLALLEAKDKQKLLAGLPQVLADTKLNVLREEMITMAEGGQKFESDAEIHRTLTGEQRLVTVRTSVAPGYEHSLGKVLVSLVDITEQKRTEQALRESEKKFRSFVESSSEGFTLVDEQGVIIEWNPAREKMTGFPASQVIGQKLWDVQYQMILPELQTPEFYERFKQTLLDALQTGQSPIFNHVIEAEAIHPHRPSQFIQQTIFPIKTDKGYRIGSVTSDITERKRAEEELRAHRDHLEELVRERTSELVVAKDAAEEARRLAEAAQSAAEAASQAKNTFLANMSHELRTPLNAILGYAQILQRRPSVGPDVITALNTIQRSGEHLLTLINDILDIARIEAGRLELFPAPIHFPGFLDHVASIIRSRAQAKGLTFSFEGLNVLPVGVQADETRLRQVLLNLLDNAVKFTDEGQVTFRVKRASESARPRRTRSSRQRENAETVRSFADSLTRIRFEVHDTGIGIPPDQLERIFLPFEQAGDDTRQREGAGLGLAVSRQLVRLMGGDIHVASPPSVSPIGGEERGGEGPGSTFWFEVALPVTGVAVEVTPPPEQVIIGYQGPRRTVLVVDDVPSNRAVLVDLLQPLGFDVIEAADGQQAIYMAQELRPDLILMDRWMPVLDGFEAAQQMRQIPGLGEVTIVAVSASVSAEDQAQSREAGIDAFLPKPIHWPRLAALLEEHLELEWEYQEPGGTFLSAPLVPPPKGELEVLLDLARKGDMGAIRERAAHVATLGEQYAPFAGKLRQLAKSFEDRALLALIKQHAEKEP